MGSNSRLASETSLNPRPELVALEIADSVERWEALGFATAAGQVELGGVRVVLGAEGTGITRWAIRGIGEVAAIDGLPTTPAESLPPAGKPAPHPNRATGIDHVVVVTPDFDRTSRALSEAGVPLRRVREAGTFRQGFRRLGPAILELVEAKTAPPGAASFWGLVVIVEDLDALSDRLGEDLGSVKAAVQPGRRIATLRGSAGLSSAVAFMDPPVRPSGDPEP
jgi:hypothetical protein